MDTTILTNHVIVVSYNGHHDMNEAKEVHLCMCLADQYEGLQLVQENSSNASTLKDTYVPIELSDASLLDIHAHFSRLSSKYFVAHGLFTTQTIRHPQIFCLY